jgi:DNA polymerase-4
MVMAIEVNPTTYYLKINYEYGVKVKQSITVDRIFSETLFKSILSQIYEDIAPVNKGAIKLSLNVSNFTSLHKKTLSLIDLDSDIVHQKLSKEIQGLRERFGLDIIKTGDEL